MLAGLLTTPGYASAAAGDSLAAEYVLLALLSKVTGAAGGAPLGACCLNITNCPSSTSFAGNVVATLQVGLARCSWRAC